MKALPRIVIPIFHLILVTAFCSAQENKAPRDPGSLKTAVQASEGAVSTPEMRESALRILSKGPLRFEKNAGQFTPRVKFSSRGVAHSLFLAPDEAVLVVTHQDAASGDKHWAARRHPRLAGARRTVARIKLANANPLPVMEGMDELPGRSNYLRGRNKSSWQTEIPNYARVRYREVYRGVDWVYYGNEGRLEYDFVLSPGADPAQIAMNFSVDGSAMGEAARIDASGDLILSSDPEGIRLHRPVAYQIANGQKQLVAANFALRAPGRVGFDLGPYDANLPLIIDPVLTFSTYLGGGVGNAAFGVAVDATGIYVAGQTDSGDFPTTAGAVQTDPGTGTTNCSSSIDPSPCFDAFVTKLSPDGTTLVYSTFLGGSGLDGAFGIAVDGNGNAIVAGGTFSADFPVTATAFQPDIAPGGACQDSGGSPITCEDAFVTVINNLGTGFVYSTYLGGSGSDFGLAASVDSSGNAYATGFTDSDAASFPETAGVPGGGTCAEGASTFPCGDAFLAKFDPDAATAPASRVYARYIGGNSDEFGNGVAVESSTGNAFVTGTTIANSTGGNTFSVTNGFQPAFGGGGVDGFIAEVNSTGSTILYSSFLGGSDVDQANAIALDSTGMAYLTGFTRSSNFQVKNAFEATRHASNCATCFDAFLTKVDTALVGSNSLVYSTYLGGSGDDGGFAVTVDSSANAYVAGGTTSTGTATKPFPLSSPLQSVHGGNFDVFLSKFNSAGSALTFSTYLGGTGAELGSAVAVGPSSEVVIAGRTDSVDFPITVGAVFTAPQGLFDDAFIARIDPANSPSAAFSTDFVAFGAIGVGFTSVPQSVVLTNTGTATLNINVTITGTHAADFDVEPSTTCGASVAAGSNCRFDLTFTAGATGARDAFLTITDNAAGSPHSIALSGTGATGPVVTLSPPATLAFPNTTVGTTSAALQITVTNSGVTNLNITSVTKVGTAYTVSGCSAPPTVTPGNSCVISVTFSPTASGIITGSVTITDDAPGSPRTVALTGTGVQPDYSVTTPDNSKTVAAGATASYTLTITPTNGFNQQITFTCSGAPVRSTCQPPAAITPNGSNTPVDVTLNVVTQSRSAVPPGVLPFTAPPLKAPQSYLPWLVAWLMLSLASLMVAGRRRRATVLLTAALLMTLLWTACGGGGGGGGTTPPATGTPAGTYNITATATSGTLSKQIALTLVVQ